MAPKEQSRVVHIAANNSATYCSNQIKTSKYTWYSFVPVNLFEQLHKMGNVYFLLISVLMYIGEHTDFFIGTIKAFSTFGTLAMMMTVSAVVALLDDNKRKAADREANEQAANHIHIGVGGKGSKDKKAWEQVKVGDILVVHEGDELPADIVPLFCSGEDGACYVSTANLDGETNLKLKAAAPLAQKALACGQSSGIAIEDVQQRLHVLSEARVEAEAPQTSIHVFTGTFTLQQAQDSLSADNLLLRGTVLRNTKFALGVVIYTGRETRMVMNSRQVPLKLSNLEGVTNSVMIVVLLAQGLMAFFSDLLYLSQKGEYEDLWYLPHKALLLPDVISYWLTFFVLYSNMMPISLYPTMEFCNSLQTYFIRNDIQMYFKELNFPAGVRSSNLCQEIGQVGYVFSDKTGTLTQNVMELKKFCVNGEIFGEMAQGRGFTDGERVAAVRSRDPELAKKIDDFLEVLAVSHTCMVSIVEDGSLRYDAESPDESALVETAAQLGWKFTSRQGNSATVTNGEKVINYEVLATNAFNSDRKRMSVLVKVNKNGSEEYCLLVKGADNVMKERATCGTDLATLDQTLSSFATEGLRTLLVGKKKLEAKVAEDWLKTFNEAQRTLTDRDGALAKVAEALEKDVEILGITAIEDKLQDHVPETIEKLRNAGIKVWVLTGDKLETARNIGFSSKVLVDKMSIVTLDREPPLAGQMTKAEAMFKNRRPEDKALMVTGAALEEILASDSVKRQFLDMAEDCSVVIACRVSPLQKAQMVRLVREGVTPCPVTLGIGDGANDVPMIQEAQVGVGIAGREGRQAVNNSDFAIGQFSYLQRLLLVHGRWNYRRASKFTIFTFWRNAVQVLCIFYYTLVSGFSGTSIFEDWVRLSFNFLCSLPVMATGCMDQDITAKTALSNPRQYIWGREGLDLNATKMVGALASALVHSLIIAGVCWTAYPSFVATNAGDYYTFGTMTYCCLVLDMNYRVFFLNYTHNKYTLGALALSCLGLACFLIVYPMIKPITFAFVSNMYMTTYHFAKVAPFWICLVAIPIISLNVDLSISKIGRLFSSEERELVILKSKESPGSQYQRLPEELQSRPLVSPSSDSMEEEQEKKEDGLVAGLEVTDFSQQSSASVPIDMSHWATQGCAAGMAIVLVLLGLYIRHICHATAEIRLRYFPNVEGYNVENPPLHDDGSTGQHIVTLTPTVTLRAPILVQYHMGPYYQNANTYLKSEVPQELRGLGFNEGLRDTLCSESSRESRQGDATNEIYPCGMKVISFFNDTYSINETSIDETGIAWEADLDRFANPEDYERRGGTLWLHDMFPAISKQDGVDDEHFAVWMRPSAGTSVTKRWGWINKDIEAGTQLTVTIHDNYPMNGIEDGHKELVLTNLNAFGASDIGLAQALIHGGALALLLSVTATLLGNSSGAGFWRRRPFTTSGSSGSRRDDVVAGRNGI